MIFYPRIGSKLRVDKMSMTYTLSKFLDFHVFVLTMGPRRMSCQVLDPPCVSRHCISISRYTTSETYFSTELSVMNRTVSLLILGRPTLRSLVNRYPL